MPETTDRRLSRLANFSWTLAGRVAYILAQWLTLVVIARVGTADVVGDFGLALAISAPIFMFAQLGLRDFFTVEEDVRSFNRFVVLRLTMTLGALALASVIPLVLGYAREVTLTIIGVALAKAIENISDVFYGAMQRSDRMDVMAWSFVARGAAGVAAVTVVLLYTESLALSMFAMAASWLLVLLVHDIPRGGRVLGANVPIITGSSRDDLRNLALVALPLGVLAMLSSVQSNVARYLLEVFDGRTAIGYFTAIAYTLVACDVIAVALSKSALTMLRRKVREDLVAFRAAIRRLILTGAGVGLSAILIGLLFGKTLLSLIYGTDYGAYALCLIILLVGRLAVFVNTYVKAAQMAMKTFRTQMVGSVIGIAIGTLCGLLLVPRYGVNGAAATVAVTQWLVLLYGILVLRQALRQAETTEGMSEEAVASAGMIAKWGQPS